MSSRWYEVKEVLPVTTYSVFTNPSRTALVQHLRRMAFSLATRAEAVEFQSRVPGSVISEHTVGGYFIVIDVASGRVVPKETSFQTRAEAEECAEKIEREETEAQLAQETRQRVYYEEKDRLYREEQEAIARQKEIDARGIHIKNIRLKVLSLSESEQTIRGVIDEYDVRKKAKLVELEAVEAAKRVLEAELDKIGNAPSAQGEESHG